MSCIHASVRGAPERRVNEMDDARTGEIAAAAETRVPLLPFIYRMGAGTWLSRLPFCPLPSRVVKQRLVFMEKHSLRILAGKHEELFVLMPVRSLYRALKR